MIGCASVCEDHVARGCRTTGRRNRPPWKACKASVLAHRPPYTTAPVLTKLLPFEHAETDQFGVDRVTALLVGQNVGHSGGQYQTALGRKGGGVPGSSGPCIRTRLGSHLVARRNRPRSVQEIASQMRSTVLVAMRSTGPVCVSKRDKVTRILRAPGTSASS
eukprot:2376224-Rhodomonas_salina.2